MKIKKISIPPNYFYTSLIISLLSWWFIPSLNIIHFSYNSIGWILVILGMYITYWAWKTFKKYDTPEDFSQSKALVTDGPFKFSRNPMYIGMFLIVLGAAICFRNIIGLVGSLVFFLVMNFMFIPFEEEKNKKTFGQKFFEYKKRVRKWL